MTIYYTEEEFGVVVFQKLAEAFIVCKANPDKDLTAICFNDGSMEYAIRGRKVLKTKREHQGFVILFSQTDTPF